MVDIRPYFFISFKIIIIICIYFATLVHHRCTKNTELYA